MNDNPLISEFLKYRDEGREVVGVVPYTWQPAKYVSFIFREGIPQELLHDAVDAAAAYEKMDELRNYARSEFGMLIE